MKVKNPLKEGDFKRMSLKGYEKHNEILECWNHIFIPTFFQHSINPIK